MTMILRTIARVAKATMTVDSYAVVEALDMLLVTARAARERALLRRSRTTTRTTSTVSVPGVPGFCATVAERMPFAGLAYLIVLIKHEHLLCGEMVHCPLR